MSDTTISKWKVKKIPKIILRLKLFSKSNLT